LAGLELTRRRSAAPQGPAPSPEESIEELAQLAESAGAEVIERVLQTRERPEAATLLGSGKIDELSGMASGMRADLVIFDHDLTPTQQRNLEKALAIKVIDRTQLILDIFARRARTREGRLQVELAQLNYLLPRLAGRGIEMSRLGGGIGTRGPGETKLETDRRRIARRIKRIERDLENVRAGRAVHRQQRSAVPLATVALVGYTNAGKSTLFNRLTRAGVLADARMFATLDPTVRGLELPSRRRVLLSDTVGFIRNLPTTLVRAFRATLEEIKEATLVLHVLDVSSPQAASHREHVLEVLAEIGASDIPRLLVLNKFDQAPAEEIQAARRGEQEAVVISALTGDGIPELAERVDRMIALDPVVRACFRLPIERGAEISLLHERGRVLSTRYSESHCEVEVEVPESVKMRLREYIL
jgi:GTPase